MGRYELSDFEWSAIEPARYGPLTTITIASTACGKPTSRIG